MKRLISVILLNILAALTTTVFAFGSGTWTWCDIHLKNGEVLESVWFNMPVTHETKISVKLDDKKQVLLADSIDCIILWSEKYPEEKHIFKSFRPYYFNSKEGSFNQSADPIWLCLEKVGKNCSSWREIGRPDFKKGRLRFKFNKMYSYLGTLHFMKNTDLAPSYLPHKTKDARKWVEVFFGDDPEVIEKYRNGEYEASDWGNKYTDYSKIIEDYTPSSGNN